MVDSTFGQRLDRALEAHGLSNAEFARAIDPEKGQQIVRNWRSRERIGAPSARKVRELLPGASVDWINEGEGPEPVEPKVLSQERPTQPAPLLASQPVRLDPGMLAQTHEFLETAFALQGKEFDLRSNWDLFADAYDYLVEDDRPVDQRNLVDFGRWLAARQAKGGSDAESQRTAGEAAGKDRRRQA